MSWMLEYGMKCDLLNRSQISTPPPKKHQTTTRKPSTDIRNENHQIPPEHPLENVGLPTPAWKLGNPTCTNHSSEAGPACYFRRQSLLKTSALALVPLSLPKKLHKNPPLEKFRPRSIGGAPNERRRRRVEKRSSKRVFWRKLMEWNWGFWCEVGQRLMSNCIQPGTRHILCLVQPLNQI